MKKGCRMKEKSEKVLTSEAGRISGYSAERIRQLADAGLLPCERVGRVRLIDRAAVEELAKRRQGK